MAYDYEKYNNKELAKEIINNYPRGEVGLHNSFLREAAIELAKRILPDEKMEGKSYRPDGCNTGKWWGGIK